MKLFEREKVLIEFGRTIRSARENKGMLQAHVAEELGVSRSYYAMIENGDREIYFTLALNICKVLEVDMIEFMKKLK